MPQPPRMREAKAGWARAVGVLTGCMMTLTQPGHHEGFRLGPRHWRKR